MRLIDWGSVEQAIEAAEQLFTGSFGSGCRGDHLMLWTDTESVHTARIGPPQPPLPLADELGRLLSHPAEPHHAVHHARVLASAIDLERADTERSPDEP